MEMLQVLAAVSVVYLIAVGTGVIARYRDAFLRESGTQRPGIRRAGHRHRSSHRFSTFDFQR